MTDDWYVMPQSQWNDARTHHPADGATRDDPAALCDEISDQATLRIATPADRDCYGLCRVCQALAADADDPRGSHGQSDRTPVDVLREYGFDAEAEALEADHV